MGEILDRGSLLFASIAAAAAGLLLLGVLIGRTGTLRTVFQRDYSPLLTCVAMAWTASQIPIILAQWTGPMEVVRIVAGLSYLYFAALVFFAVRTVFGTGNGPAVLIVALSWIPLAAAALLWGPLSMIFGLLASPFFLFFIIYYLGAEF